VRWSSTAVDYAIARSIDVVIVDMEPPGRLHTKSSLMDELKKIRRIAERKGEVTEALLVPRRHRWARTASPRPRTFGEAVQVTGVVLDQARRLGPGAGIVVPSRRSSASRSRRSASASR